LRATAATTRNRDRIVSSTQADDGIGRT